MKYLKKPLPRGRGSASIPPNLSPSCRAPLPSWGTPSRDGARLHLRVHVQFLVSAGEASGDMYAAGVVEHLRRRFPTAHFFGCAGPKLQEAGVEPVVDAANLSVVGLAE